MFICPSDKEKNNDFVWRLLMFVSNIWSLQMDLHEAQKGGGGPIGSPHEINNLKQQLQDTKRKLEAAEKLVEEKTQACNDLENKLKVGFKLFF